MVKAVSQTAGVFLAMGLLSTWLRISDPVLGSLGSISQLCSCFIYAFAKTNTMIYTAAGIDILNGVMAVVARSIASKLVSSGEQGKLHSLFAVSDTINPIVSNVIFGSLYRTTLDVLPGAFFLLSAADTIPPLIIFLYFIYFKL
jgi:MFS-type transporter involved in bile tolerance (Atg22 family)